jgi:hypothetical protein
VKYWLKIARSVAGVTVKEQTGGEGNADARAAVVRHLKARFEAFRDQSGGHQSLRSRCKSQEEQA